MAGQIERVWSQGESSSNRRVACEHALFQFIRATTTQESADLLWTAPELLRDDVREGTKPADIYAFAIVAAEVLNMRPVWESNEPTATHESRGNGDVKRTADGESKAKQQFAHHRAVAEIVYLVKKKGAHHPHRPHLEPLSADVSPALVRQTHVICSPNVYISCSTILYATAGASRQQLDQASKPSTRC